MSSRFLPPAALQSELARRAKILDEARDAHEVIGCAVCSSALSPCTCCIDSDAGTEATKNTRNCLMCAAAAAAAVAAAASWT